jgi:hypothetical protein
VAVVCHPSERNYTLFTGSHGSDRNDTPAKILRKDREAEEMSTSARQISVLFLEFVALVRAAVPSLASAADAALPSAAVAPG